MCNKSNWNLIKPLKKQRVMGLWSIIPVVFLLSFCRLTETTGICKFKTMFPTGGKREYYNGGTVAQVKARRQETTLTPCPPNMIHGNCTCVATCEDPTGNTGCFNTCMDEVSCPCPAGSLMKNDLCVPQTECGCYLSEAKKVITNMGSYVFPDCSTRCSCINNELACKTLECGPNSVCEENNNNLKCYCKDGFIGDGQNCILATDCHDFFNAGFNESGIYKIKPHTWSGSVFEVFCNMDHDEGWTVFQRRVNGSVDFFRNWEDYKQGFGVLNHEFWLGNDKIYSLTNQRNYTLRIDLVNSLGSPFYALYKHFQIASEANMYNLKNVDVYNGTAGPDGMNRHKGVNFSTRDRDNDDRIDGNCATLKHGAWWYKSCGPVNLNGGYFEKRHTSIRWSGLPGNEYKIKFTEMKIRP